MPDLIAQGVQPEHRWRRRLKPGVRQAIGRQSGEWSTPWDDRISRRHVEVEYRDGQLHVEALPAAKNPVFFRGQRASRFSLAPGEHFVVGETTFSLVDHRVNVSLNVPRPDNEQTFAVEELRRQPFREADKRIDVLSRLPSVISGSGSDEELFSRLVNLLLSGIERATAAAVVAVEGSGSREGEREQKGEEEQATIRVLHWDRRVLASSEFRPSERLIRQTTESGESVVHVWGASGSRVIGGEEFTLSEGTDWALCTPVPGKPCAGWALYVTGSFSSDFGPRGPEAELLRDDVKFTELVATTLGGLRESQLLVARQASLSQFFSPTVLEAIGNDDFEHTLAPRQADVTVLFCDLRGFTHQSERSAGDLLGLLARVSQALGVTTHHILQEGGVIGDFHGDAVMGFWGWPLPQPDAPQRACRAALRIQAAFASGVAPDASDQEENSGALRDFRVGIGIASGRAVAGKIGTQHQVKVTAFGPVVNLAARLETMTKQLGASILVDSGAATAIRDSLPGEVCRVRRLARIRPVGFTAAVEVYELLPPVTEIPQLGDDRLAEYERAAAEFTSGRWEQARALISALPTTDHAARFLSEFMAKQGDQPPPDWDGTIPLREK